MAANVERVELWMSFNNAYRPVLSIPVATCGGFSVHPLAWLRYVAFTIYGTEGYISSEQGGNEVDYYTTAGLPGTYYYVSRGHLLLDPDIMDDRTSDTSDITDRRGNFRARVVARDENCVLTGTPASQACHIIPHAKGDKYMKNLVYLSFGASRAAFLQTPNFAMAATDVDLVEQPTANFVPFVQDPSVAFRRLTFQHFDVNDPILPLIAPHNSDAWQSDSNEWPPPLMFDISYGCAALKTWGVPGFQEFTRQLTRDTYYNFDDDDDAEDDNSGDAGGSGSGGGSGGEGPRRSKRIRSQLRNFEAAKGTKSRTVGWPAGNTEDGQADNIADIVMALWMHNAKKRPRQAHSVEVDSPGEKVRAWLESAE